MKDDNNKTSIKEFFYNKTGFSLVELLGVIVILGIMAAIGSAAVIKYVKMSKDRYEETQIEFIKSAAKEYLTDHKTLPRNNGGSVCVRISDLISDGYISKIKDSSDNTCTFDTYNGGDPCSNGDIVKVTKVNNKEFSYTATFSKCFKDHNDKEVSKDNEITYTIHYNANGGSGAPKDQIKKKDVSLKLSTTKPKRNGYSFVGWSTSKVASSAAWKSGADFTDNKSVTLYAVWTSLKYDITISNSSKGKWSSGNVTINCTANNSSTVLKWQYSTDDTNWVDIPSSNKTSISQTFTSEMNQKYYYRACEDAETCSDSLATVIKIDKTAPTVPSLSNSFGDRWMNSSNYSNTAYYLDCTTVENGSGINYWAYSYDNANFIREGNSNKNPYRTTPFTAERYQYAYIIACDKAGNCSNSSRSMIKIDKTAPSRPSLTLHNTTSDYYISCSTTENVSGVDYWQYAVKSGMYYGSYSIFPNSSSTSFNTPTYTDRMKFKFQVCDKAGNCSGSNEIEGKKARW